MIQLLTNAPQYSNDIAEVIRLFFGMVKISQEGPAELCLAINLAPEQTVGTLEPGNHHCAIAITPAPSQEVDSACQRDSSVDTLDTDTENCFPNTLDALRLEQKRREKYALKRCVYALLQSAYPQVHPWGSLTGIRPTKLLREMTGRHGGAEALRQFTEVFSVTPQKRDLAVEICRVQADTLASVSARDVDIYVGIPYCKSRCLYCSFGAEVPRGQDVLSSYLATLLADIRAGGALVRDGGLRVRALYVGGGTPTVLSAPQLEELLGQIALAYGAFAETTVEAGRPDTITAEKLAVLRAQSIQRVSVNPQTMNDLTLQRIGRAHTAAQTEEAMALVRAAGFPVVNMDLIAGLPGESAADMAHTLSRIRQMAPENLTAHSLAIKRSSGLHQRLEQYPLPTAETTLQMLTMCAETAAAMGMQPYYLYRQKYMSGNLENVGYATPETVCRYNIDMMEESCSILAHGAGAMSKRVFSGENRVERLPNPKDAATYREKLPLLLERKRELFSYV